MPELTPRERLQPSLLDRLTDEEPESDVESRDHRVMSPRKFREAVIRDLAWLLNSSQRRRDDEIWQYEGAASSVLNYGVRDLSGMTSSGVSAEELEREIAGTIRAFEPRILPGSVQVRVVVDSRAASQHALQYEISGELWGNPVPEALYVRTSVDLETGACTVEESSGG